MKKQVYEQSVQSARIDLNLLTNRVKFEYPTKKYTKFQEWLEVGAVLFLPYIIILGISYFLYIIITFDFFVTIEYTTKIIILQEITNGIIAVSIFFGPPSVLSFIMVLWKRELLRHFPKLQYFFAKPFRNSYVARFENLKTKQVEIPLFRNVILNYKATGQCGKYLKRIKITEHPFMQIVTKKSGFAVRPNDYLWKCLFYFDKIPKTGRLDVYFI